MQFVRGREFGEDSEVTPHPPQAVPPLPLESVKAGERNCVRGREFVRRPPSPSLNGVERSPCLAAARSRSGSNSHPDCYSRPSRRYATREREPHGSLRSQCERSKPSPATVRLPWGGSLLILFGYSEKVRIFRKITADFKCYRGY